MKVLPTSQRGRRIKLGGVCFDGNHLAFFAGYHECTCGVKGKILINIDDARALAQKFGGNRSGMPIGVRIARRTVALTALTRRPTSESFHSRLAYANMCAQICAFASLVELDSARES